MRKMFCSCLFLLLISFLGPAKIIAQTSKEDSSWYSSAINNATDSYHSFLGQQTELYSGAEYVPYPQTITEGHPFFQSVSIDTGSIMYNGIYYKKIPMFLDLVQNALVIINPVNTAKVQVYNEMVQRFTLFGHNFIRVVTDSLKNPLLNTGFYDLLYAGKVSLLKKQSKNIQENYSSGDIRVFVQEKHSYYIEKDGNYYSVSNKSSVLNVLADRKKEIRQFIRQNKIKLGKNMDEGLASVLSYYDGLMK
jgi:hypothetical protein